MLIRILAGTVIVLAAAALAGRRLAWLVRLVRAGQPDPGRGAGAGAWLRATLADVLGQRKLFLRPRSGIPHAVVFWGFLVLLATVAEALGATFVSRDYALPVIGHAGWAGLTEDLFAVAVLAGLVALAALRLWESPATRGRGSRFYGSHLAAAWLTLALIALVVLTLLGYRAAQLDAGEFPYSRAAFATSWLAAALRPLGAANTGLATGLLLANLAALAGFGVFLSYSKHLHIITGPVNVALGRRPNALGGLAVPPAAAAPDGGQVAALTWKQRLDTLACTECGRCQAVCPAWNAGLPLSPKLAMMSLRDGLLAGTPAPMVSSEALWSCTTCGACVRQCPVAVEHVDTIVHLRRRLVDAGEIEPGVARVLTGEARQRNSFGKAARARAQWTRDLGFTIKDARREAVRYLWFVGDFAAFDDRLQDLSRRLARILSGAGVDFGILYDSESDDGNDVRRTGEEGLFQLLAAANLEAFAAAQFAEIFTTDPHSFNTLRNEYPALGLRRPVWHYSQLLERLVADGAIGVRPLNVRVTYHDPCYLARHNGLTGAPRRLLRALGCDLAEMPRHGLDTYCCGAGGGRIWMSGPAGPAGGERPAESRIAEAMALGVSTLVVACPRDFVMYSEAVRATGNEGRIEVADLTDLVGQAREVAG